EDNGGRGPVLEISNGYADLVWNSELEEAEIKSRAVVCSRRLVLARGRAFERDEGSGYEIAIYVNNGAANTPDLRVGSRNVLRHRWQYHRQANQEQTFPKRHCIPHTMEEMHGECQISDALTSLFSEGIFANRWPCRNCRRHFGGLSTACAGQPEELRAR